MQIIRKIILFFTITTFIGLLFLTAFAWTVNHTFARRETVKAWLSESGAYEHFVDEVARVAKTKQSTDQAKSGDGDVSKLDIDTIKTAAEKAFPPSMLKSNLEGVIDGTYDWLDGKNPRLEFTIDLSAAKKTFAQELGNVAIAKNITLPVCPAGTPINDYDPLNATCIPKGVNVNTEIQNFVTKLQSSNEILPDTTVNADLIQVDRDGTKQRIDQAFPSVPKYYRLGKNGAWVLTGLSLLWAFLILLFSASRRFGVKHLAKSFLIVALTLTTTSLILRPLTDKLSDSFLRSRSDVSSFSQQIVIPLVQKINNTSKEWGLVFTAIYGFIGLGLVILLLATRKHPHTLPKLKEDDKHATPEKPANNLHPESVEASKLAEPKGPPETPKTSGKIIQG